MEIFDYRYENNAFGTGGGSKSRRRFVNAATRYLLRAAELAERGRGRVEPNPCVGAVLADDLGVVGEGWHGRYGGPHAEPVAFDDVRDASRVSGAVLYVTLEPCNHKGKTPPCTERILAENVKTVVVGRLDPNPLMAGKSLRRLRERGVNVVLFDDAQDTGLARKLDELLRTFRVNMSLRRPYVALKWAQSADGALGRQSAGQVGVTGPAAQKFTHRLRAELGAVWVGGRTAAGDDPLLNVRFAPGGPVRRLVVAERPLPPNLRLFQPSSDPVWIISPYSHPAAKNIPLESDLKTLLESLYRDHDLGAVLVEGGRATHERFISAGLWDRIYVYQSLRPLRLPDPVPAPSLPMGAVLKDEFCLGSDVVRVYEPS